MAPHATFGRFELLRLLGRGMTDVYLAFDPAHNRRLIVKIIENASSPDLRACVEAEERGARIQQDLHRRNPEILEVYEWGEREDRFFVAMEYFPGRTLAEMIAAEGKLESSRAARYAAEICRQLRILHEFTAIHGDIKPSNIQIGARDDLRLLDFGIAKIIRPGRDLTHHELGSPSYCSPERLNEYAIDVRADLWAVGVTLFEMLTGAPPFQARDTRELEKLIKQKPPLAIPPDCPPRLASILKKSLAPEPADRYSSAAEFEGALRDSSPKLRFIAPAPARRLSAQYSLAAALLTGILAGLLLFLPLAYHLRLAKISRSLGEPKDYSTLPAATLVSDWQLYQILHGRNSWWRRLVSTEEGERAFRANVTASPGYLIDAFRRSSDDQARFNWAQARLCALYALQLDPESRQASGEFHLANGFLFLQDRSHAGIRTSYAEFRKAAALLPASPVPYLGMSRLYAAKVRNIGAALSMLHQAQARGYHLGPREFQQQADAYLYRAETELSRARESASTARQDALRYLRLAHDDFERARNIYEPINGFAHAGTNLARIEGEQSARANLETALLAPPKPHLVLLKVRFGRHSGGGTLRWR